jgi:dephospho-CoA kinase
MERETEKQTQRPRIVAVVGATAAGKDVLAEYLARQYHAKVIEVGAFARQLHEEAEQADPHLQYDTSAKNMAGYGSAYIMQRLVAEIVEVGEQNTHVLVLTGVRTPAEAAALKSHFGSDLLLAYVKTGDQKLRFERVQQRNFATDADDFHEFSQHDEHLKSKHGLAETAVLADITLLNNESLEAYYKQIETCIVPHLFSDRKRQ